MHYITLHYNALHYNTLHFAQPVAGLKRGLGGGGAVHGKVLENEKVVRGNQNVGKMWGSNGIKLVFGPGV